MSFRNEDQIQQIVNLSKGKYFSNAQQLSENWQEGLGWEGLDFNENQLIVVNNQLFVCDFIGSTLDQKNIAADELNRMGYADFNQQLDYSEANYVDSDYVQ